eukprot:SAG31_NODE_420_length_15868_cov_11.896823_5_plen_69_part_00
MFVLSSLVVELHSAFIILLLLECACCDKGPLGFLVLPPTMIGTDHGNGGQNGVNDLIVRRNQRIIENH